MSEPDFIAIHQIVAEIFKNDPEWWPDWLTNLIATNKTKSPVYYSSLIQSIVSGHSNLKSIDADYCWLIYTIDLVKLFYGSKYCDLIT